MIDMELSFDQPPANHVAREAEEYQARLVNEVAFETEKAMRRRTTLWPQRSGYSRDRFRAEDDHHGNILITNTAPYARFVNFVRAFASGKRNPNFNAVQRTVEKFWPDITRRAARKAE